MLNFLSWLLINASSKLEMQYLLHHYAIEFLPHRYATIINS